MESCSMAVFAVEPNLTPLHLYQRLGNAESKASPGRIPDLLVFRAEKLLEDLSPILLADPKTFILYSNIQDL